MPGQEKDMKKNLKEINEMLKTYESYVERPLRIRHIHALPNFQKVKNAVGDNNVLADCLYSAYFKDIYTFILTLNGSIAAFKDVEKKYRKMLETVFGNKEMQKCVEQLEKEFVAVSKKGEGAAEELDKSKTIKNTQKKIKMLDKDFNALDYINITMQLEALIDQVKNAKNTQKMIERHVEVLVEELVEKKGDTPLIETLKNKEA